MRLEEGAEDTADASRLVVFGDDWGRHPSGTQHFIRQLLPRYRVDWINTIGTRRPRPNLADARRGLEKLACWLAPHGNGTATAQHPRVHSPVHWPGFGRRWERRLNRWLLLRHLRAVLPGPASPVAAITAIPIAADVAAALPHLNWVYFCGDSFREWPGYDGQALAEMELDLLPLMRRIIVVSEALRDRFARLGFRSSLLTLGVDLAHWSRVRRRALPKGGRRPVAMFWGLADRRLDADVCRALARRCDLVMVGPHEDVDPALLRAPGIRWQGRVPYGELPGLAALADVLVMPYADLPVTRAMQPLKLKEYLATGLPVVATPLPENRAWSDAMDLAADPGEFARLAAFRAAEPLPRSQAEARRRLHHEGWAAKGLAFERLLFRDDAPAIGNAQEI